MKNEPWKWATSEQEGRTYECDLLEKKISILPLKKTQNQIAQGLQILTFVLEYAHTHQINQDGCGKEQSARSMQPLMWG